MLTFFSLDLTAQLGLGAVMLLAGLAHGALGLGFPMIATPVIAIFFDVRVAIMLTLLPTAAVNIGSIFGGSANSRAVAKYFPLILGSLVGAVCGSFLLIAVDPDPFRLVLAVLILVFLFASAFGNLPMEKFRAIPVLTMLTFGLIAGISGGTTNVMVAILLVYFLTMQTPRTELVPALNSCFLIGKVSQISVFLFTGAITFTHLLHTFPLLVCAILGLWLGQKLGDRIEVETYRRALNILLMFLAGILIFQYFAR